MKKNMSLFFGAYHGSGLPKAFRQPQNGYPNASKIFFFTFQKKDRKILVFLTFLRYTVLCIAKREAPEQRYFL
jgi:hypothetical protein